MKKLLSVLIALVMLLGCMALAEGSIAGTYSFDEQAMGGAFNVPWTLILNEDGTYQIIEDNPFMGQNTYEGTYTVEDGIVITGAFEGNPPQADFFAADKTCKWTLNDDGTCVPVDYDPNAAPNMGGTLPQGGGMPQGDGFPGGGIPQGGLPEGGLPEGGLPQGGMPGMNQGAAESNADYANVAYASVSASEVCDIYLPEGDGPFPVIVLSHGGGFMFGNQMMDIIQPVIEASVANGYAVVSVDYRKSNEASFPAALSDVKAAVRFVRANAAEYNFDADHIAVWGESAGAYLSLMTALTPAVSELDGDVADNAEQSSAATALVDFYGPVEFSTMTEEAEALGNSFSGDFEKQFVGVDSLQDGAVAATYWETYVDQLPEDFALQAWIQVGDANDTSVPCTQSVNFAERLSAVIGEENVHFEQIEGAGHEDAAFYTDENLANVFAFLDACMK